MHLIKSKMRIGPIERLCVEDVLIKKQGVGCEKILNSKKCCRERRTQQFTALLQPLGGALQRVRGEFLIFGCKSALALIYWNHSVFEKIILLFNLNIVLNF